MKQRIKLLNNIISDEFKTYSKRTSAIERASISAHNTIIRRLVSHKQNVPAASIPLTSSLPSFPSIITMQLWTPYEYYNIQTDTWKFTQLGIDLGGLDYDIDNQYLPVSNPFDFQHGAIRDDDTGKIIFVHGAFSYIRRDRPGFILGHGFDFNGRYWVATIAGIDYSVFYSIDKETFTLSFNGDSHHIPTTIACSIYNIDHIAIAGYTDILNLYIIYVSSDGGSTWNQYTIDNIIDEIFNSSIFLIWTSSNRIITTHVSPDVSGDRSTFIYMSDDNGITWVDSYSVHSFANTDIVGICLNEDSSTVFIGVSGSTTRILRGALNASPDTTIWQEVEVDSSGAKCIGMNYTNKRVYMLFDNHTFFEISNIGIIPGFETPVVTQLSSNILPRDPLNPLSLAVFN